MAGGDQEAGAGVVVGASNGRAILWIDLAYTSDRRCDARLNCEVERARFGFRDAAGAERTGAIVDVHLRHQ